MTKKSVVEGIGVMALVWIMLGMVDSAIGHVQRVLWPTLLFALLITRTYTIAARMWRRRRS